MNIEDLTIKQARELVALFSGVTAPSEREHGLSIVVIDRGFVDVGYVVQRGDELHITRCRNIRYWGTERGLAQLVNDGPTSKTKIDDEQALEIVPMRAVIKIIPVEVSKWKKQF